jgi:predicted RNase H-like HicB family nuclease
MPSSSTVTATVKADVPVYLFEQDAQWVAYCPPLELSSYGDTLDEAKSAFTEALEILIEELIERKSLERELLRLEWTLEQTAYLPPEPPARKIHALGKATRVDQRVVFPSVNGSASHPSVQASRMWM